MASLDGILTKSLVDVLPSKEAFLSRFKSKPKLRIYLGIDPTSPNIHLGHTIPLLKLREFQKANHQVILLFGDFTGTIGDPSGRDTMRVPLTRQQIEKNVATYKNQAEKILDFKNNPPEIRYNSEWWDKMKLTDFFGILSLSTVSQLLERDMFQERIRSGKPIATSEFLYPLLQGYDSVALDVDIEIGGTDQTFNMLSGRELMKNLTGKEKFVLTTPLLEGTDGRKMSKSFGNTIDLQDQPNSMYGRVMSLKDELIGKYFDLVTDLSEGETDKFKKLKNPMEAKKALAHKLVDMYHGEESAKKAEEEFEKVFQKGERTSNITNVKGKKSVLPLSYASLVTTYGGTSSISEAVRLAENKGLRVNEKLIEDARELFSDPQTETIIDIGKRKSIKINWED